MAKRFTDFARQRWGFAKQLFLACQIISISANTHTFEKPYTTYKILVFTKNTVNCTRSVVVLFKNILKLFILASEPFLDFIIKLNFEQ